MSSRRAASLVTSSSANGLGPAQARARIRSFADIPGPSTYPLLGSLHHFLNGTYDRFKYHEVLKHYRRQFGPLVKENFGGKEIVHVFDPEDIKTVYSHESKRPVVPPLQETTQMYRAQKQMSLGLGNTNGEEWYRLRANSQKRMLRPKEVQHHLPSVNRIAQDFSLRLARVRYDVNDEVSDLRSEVGRWSLDNAGMLVFSKRLGCLQDDSSLAVQMLEANAKIFEYSGTLKLSLPLYKYVTTPKWRELVKSEDLFYSKSIELVDDTILRLRRAVEKGESVEEDFYLLSYLLTRTDLSLKDVTVICLSLFSDGLSTTTPTLLFNLYCLATNQEAQEKVYQEIVSVIGPDVKKGIKQEHIDKMPYLKAFIKETFRLWPNGTEVSRYTESDMVLSGYEIPSGTHVDMNPLVHFRNPDLFVDPDSHIPERWLRRTATSKADAADAAASDGDNANDAVDGRFFKQKIHNYLLTPFGHGTRMCAGRRFAEQDICVFLATVLRRFRLEYPVGEQMDQIYHTLLFPDRPVRVKFVDRK